MDMQIQLGDLGLILLGIGLLILLIYAILIFKNIYEITKNIKKIIHHHEANINELLDNAPLIATHVKSISHDLSDNIRSMQGTFHQIIHTTEKATGKLVKNQDLLGSLIGFIQILSLGKDIWNHFRSKKK